MATRTSGVITWAVNVQNTEDIMVEDAVLTNIPAEFFEDGFSPYLYYIPMRNVVDPSFLVPVLVYILPDNGTGTMFIVWDTSGFGFGPTVEPAYLSFNVSLYVGRAAPTAPSVGLGVTGLINRECLIVHRSESGNTDDYGNEIPGEELVSAVCEIQQRQREEPVEGGPNISATEWIAFFLPDEDVRTGDAVSVDDAEYEVIGEPWHARNPRTGSTSHIEATLSLVEGIYVS